MKYKNFLILKPCLKLTAQLAEQSYYSKCYNEVGHELILFTYDFKDCLSLQDCIFGKNDRSSMYFEWHHTFKIEEK